MVRLSFASAAAFAAAGAILAVALLPASKPAFRRQLSILQGDSVSNHGVWSGTHQPSLAFDPEELNLKSRDESLARAFVIFRLPRKIEVPSPPILGRPWIQALEDHLKRFPNDVEGHAHLIRMLTQTPMTVNFDKKNYVDAELWLERKRVVARRLVQLTRRAAELDSRNSFYPLVEAAADVVLNRYDLARKRIREAANLAFFDDYAVREATLLITTAERHGGYRGEALRTTLAATVVLPHYSSLKSMVDTLRRTAPKAERLSLQWALYRTQYTVLREASTLIGILVGRAGMVLSLIGREENPENVGPSIRAERVRKALDAFDHDLRAAKVPLGGLNPLKMMDDANTLSDTGKRFAEDTGISEAILEPQQSSTEFGARCLLLLGMLLPAALLVGLWSQRRPESFTLARGAAAAAILGLVTLAHANAAGDKAIERLGPFLWVVTLNFVGIAILQSREKDPRWLCAAAVGAAVVAAVAQAYTGAVVLVGGSALLTGLVYLSSRSIVASGILGLAAATAAAFALVDPFQVRLDWGAMFLALLMCAAFLLAFPVRAQRFVAPSLALLFTAGFLTGVVRSVVEDARLKPLNAIFLHEADLVRKAAQLPRLTPK